jgi:CubicO group peptidase (beta-lactamase class C family)
MNVLLRTAIFLFSFYFLYSTRLAAQTIKAYADSIQKANHIPALAYTVLNSDSILLSKVQGIRSISAGDSVQSGDYFHLGSNTKAITSFIAGKLVEEKRIDWETPFFELFPSWKSSSRKEYHSTTLSQLLSHRAGIQAFTSGIDFMKLPEFKGDLPKQRKAFCRWLLQQEKVESKKKTYIYSNASYSLAAIMLEKASRKSWEELVKEHLEDSLGLKVLFSWPNSESAEQPWGHWKLNNELSPLPPQHFYRLNPLIAPAGDLSMNLEDYSRFIQQHLRGLHQKESYLSPETLNFIHYGLPEYSMAWGWQLKEEKHHSYHDGSGGTFYCSTLIVKEEDLAIIIMINAADKDMVKGIYLLREKLLSEFKNQ